MRVLVRFAAATMMALSLAACTDRDQTLLQPTGPDSGVQGNFIPRPPVTKLGPDQFISIASGGNSNCATRMDRTVYCWGADDFGQVGRWANATCYSSSNVQTPCVKIDAPQVQQRAAGALVGRRRVHPRVRDRGHELPGLLLGERQLGEVGAAPGQQSTSYGVTPVTGSRMYSQMGRPIDVRDDVLLRRDLLLGHRLRWARRSVVAHPGSELPVERHLRWPESRLRRPNKGHLGRAAVLRREYVRTGRTADRYEPGDVQQPGRWRSDREGEHGALHDVRRSELERFGAVLRVQLLGPARQRNGRLVDEHGNSADGRERDDSARRAACDYHACAIADDKSAWCWGYNVNGQLGNNSLVDSSTPVQVGGGHTYRAVSAGQFHSCGSARTT